MIDVSLNYLNILYSLTFFGEGEWGGGSSILGSNREPINNEELGIRAKTLDEEEVNKYMPCITIKEKKGALHCFYFEQKSLHLTSLHSIYCQEKQRLVCSQVIHEGRSDCSKI